MTVIAGFDSLFEAAAEIQSPHYYVPTLREPFSFFIYSTFSGQRGSFF
jgi:hypothetical protein